MFKQKLQVITFRTFFCSKHFSCTTNIYGARGRLNKKCFPRAEFCNLVAKYAFSAKKGYCKN